MDIAGFVIQVVAAAGGGALLTWGLLKIFGEAWIANHFQKRLQELKHEQNKDMEAIRFGISDMLDRSNKLTAREFETLPNIWGLVFDAFVEADRLLQRLKRTPDFGTLSDKARTQLLDESGLNEWEKEELLRKRPHDQTIYYSELMAIRQLHRAKVAAQSADFQLKKMGVFLEEDVHRQLSDFVEFVWQAIIAHEIVHDARSDGAKLEIERHDDVFRKSADDRVAALSALMRKRFWAVR